MEKIAIIELNETALKLSIYKVSGANYALALSEQQSVAIGEEIYREELLSPQTKNRILSVFKVYRRIIENFGVEKIFAVASNILTRARNYRGFIDEIYNNTGLGFTILSDEEHIKYLFNSVVNSIDNAKGIFVYVGAFSSYVVKYNRRAILESATIPFGAYNACENGETDLDKLSLALRKKISGCGIVVEEDEATKFVGLGNAFLSLGKIAKKIERYPLDIDNNYCLSRETVSKTFDFIKGLELDKIRKIKGVSYDDADKIASGFAIINAMCEALSISNISISTANLTSGVLGLNVISLVQERVNDLLSNSLDNYYEFAKDEFSINESVHSLAVILFKQLKVMHKLPRYYVKPLRIAAFMYDSGKCINFEQFSRHGFEKIVYSDINGVSHRELLIAGFICVCQNLDEFSLNEWIKYKDILTDEDLDAVRKLGVIVKLAVNLNASKNNVIKDVVCDILGDSIIMKTIVEGDASYEINEGMNVAVDYKKVYKKSLQII